ncbi:MAG: hypothetical protein JSV80_09035, partial [Acidobacteriota bacterium]
MSSRIRGVSICALLAISCSLFPALSAPAPAEAASAPALTRVFRVRVAVDAPQQQIGELKRLGFDLHAFDRKQSVVYLGVDQFALERLRAFGFEPEIVEETTPTDEQIDALSDYHDEVESDAAITRVATDYPDIAQRFEYAYATEESRIIAGLKISDNVAIDEPEARIFFVSQHHAREVMTPEVMIDMMDLLTQGYGSDEEITWWIDNFQIYIVPNHNPDGTHHVFNVDNNWRKNRRDNGDGSFGVDLNRNYPYAWGPDGCNGSSGDPSNILYRGPSPASEPETQGINELNREIRPSISLTYHTTGELVLHPFGCSPQLPDDPDLRAHREIGSTLAISIDNDAGNGYYEMGTPYETLYEVDGGSDDWLHAIAGTVAFTIEMNTGANGFQPDYATWRDDTVLRNREGWKWLIRRLRHGAIQGRITDACTGDGLVAEVGVVEQNLTLGQEPRTSSPSHGFYHRVLEPGDYTWYAELDGYRRQEWPFSVAFENVDQDIQLVPNGSQGAALRGLALDDTSGDADGQLDPGEEVTLVPAAQAAGEAVTGLVATLSSSDPYLELLDAEASFGNLAAGEEREALDGFRVLVLADAPDEHLAGIQVSFSAVETLCGPPAANVLRITKGLPADPFEIEPLDQDPGWDFTGPAGGWEFGLPLGTGGAGGPDSAYTGENVYATNLSGSYGTTAGEFVLTSTPFDLQGLRNAELRFWRYLNNEPAYDPARVFVSIDNENWIELWSGFGRDTHWELVRIPLPAEVWDTDQVWVRFLLYQDGGDSRSGMYIDDVQFVGESILTAGGKLKYESHEILESDTNYGNADGALDAGETVTMPVTIRSTRDTVATGVTAILSTTNPEVTIHNGFADYPQIPAGMAEVSLDPHFSFTTGPDCGERISFTLEVRSDDGASTMSHFIVPVGTIAFGTLLDDDMEQDLGWTVSNPGDPGAWERSDPYGNELEGEPTNPEDDHTPDPGVACWHTQSVPPPTSVPPHTAEVDGTTVLTSPRFAARSWDTLELIYWRWFFT